MTTYTVYLKETGKMVADGTAEDCAVTLGYKSVHSFRSMLHDARYGNCTKYDVEAHTDRMPKDWEDRWQNIRRAAGVIG